MRRDEMAGLIRRRLEGSRNALRAAWQASRPVRHFACDDLLPPNLVRKIHAVFPAPADMRFSDDLRERKYAGRDTSRFQLPECP